MRSSAACRLMQPVDVLCHHCGELSLRLELCQYLVRGVWLRIFVETEHFVAVKAEKLLWFLHIKCVAQDCLWRIVILLVIESVNTPEIRDSALGRHTCPAEMLW